RAAGPMAKRRRRSAPKQIRPGVQRLLDAITGAPALVQNGRLDILGANQLARALYSELFRDPARPPNHARFNFLNPTAHDLYPDWERGADDAVALLRAEAGRDATAAGVTGDLRPHRLRGSFVSLLLWEGRSLTYAEQAGHSVATLARHYAGTMRELETEPRVPAAEAIRQARDTVCGMHSGRSGQTVDDR
ncbi:MAG TPA: hypothetical protein VLP43_02025, partial [Solirubrobacteraceae bacterium]|nr:hypothetical protein [Solirubrobacteraceae bacterium]